jgi:heme/copper-type cytochrome/quinol oxidase subunit 2
LVLNKHTKKNLLDLHYTKYLQYYTTTIIIVLTYFVGLVIAFLTNQIDYMSSTQMLLVAFTTIAFLIVVVLLILSFKEHMKEIVREIKKLNI